MKKLFLAAATLMSANTFAMSTDYKFVGLNDTQVTNICVIAAEQGISSAKRLARYHGLTTDIAFNSTQCNGVSIRRFAAKFSDSSSESKTPVEKVSYVFKAIDADPASKICKIAAEDGISAALQTGGLLAKNYVCNGISIKRFARRYNKS